VSHDKFQEIVDDANRPDSIIRTGIVIGRDIPDTRATVVLVESNLVTRVGGPSSGQPDTTGVPEQQPIFNTAREQEAAKVTLRVLKEFERLPRSTDLQQPEIRQQII